MLKITHFSTTSNGEQMADWTAFAAPILINEDQFKHFRESLREQLGGKYTYVMNRLKKTGNFVSWESDRYLIVRINNTNERVRFNGSRKLNYSKGQVLDVYYNSKLIEHPCRCFLCHGAGCYLCQYTGKSKVYSERKINLTTHIK